MGFRIANSTVIFTCLKQFLLYERAVNEYVRPDERSGHTKVYLMRVAQKGLAPRSLTSEEAFTHGPLTVLSGRPYLIKLMATSAGLVSRLVS